MGEEFGSISPHHILVMSGRRVDPYQSLVSVPPTRWC